MMPVTSENEKVHFHTLTEKAGNRVVSHYVDAVSGRPVDEDDEVKGYPRGEDDYLLLADDTARGICRTTPSTRYERQLNDIDGASGGMSMGWLISGRVGRSVQRKADLRQRELGALRCPCSERLALPTLLRRGSEMPSQRSMMHCVLVDKARRQQHP